jgi:Ca2+-transporting ATPase
MDDNAFSYAGLTADDVTAARKQWGDNRYVFEKDYTLLKTIWRLVQEPMIVLLAIASIIYFISGAISDAFFILFAIVFQSAISLYQFNRSNKALNKLKAFTAPSCKVIRDHKVITIPTEEIVIGDYLILEEGGRVAADGTIIKAHDFSVDESILTGESLPVSKNVNTTDNTVYAGTHVCTGMAVIIVSQVGLHTQLGKIGKSLESIQATSSPLEIQVNQFVKLMSIIGLIVFAVVWVFNYQHSHLFLDSLLQSLTLAMSILPEEIPVAFSTFMALGAWRLMKLGIVVKQMKTVETLGSATVICTDKTGTLTENKMSVAQIYVHADRTFFNLESAATDSTQRVIEMGMWASEPLPFDPMDLALHQTYSKHCSSDQRKDYHLVHEYPLSGQPTLLTHIYQSENQPPIIACKGAPEAIIQVCDLSPA